MKLKLLLEQIEFQKKLELAINSLKYQHKRSQSTDKFINLVRDLFIGKIDEIPRNKFGGLMGNQWGLEFIDGLVKDGVFGNKKIGNKHIIVRISSEKQDELKKKNFEFYTENSIHTIVNEVKTYSANKVLSYLNLEDTEIKFLEGKRSYIFNKKIEYRSDNKNLIDNLKVLIVLLKLDDKITYKIQNLPEISRGDSMAGEIEWSRYVYTPVEIDIFHFNEQIGKFYDDEGFVTKPKLQNFIRSIKKQFNY